jgi:ABC-type polar amino acid transport system ATPase subunit
MLKIENLSYKYPDGTVGLKKVSMEIPLERTFVILGESGSGKTTFLRCLGKFIIPQSGSVFYYDEDIKKMDNKKFRQTIGIIFQQLYLFPHMTILKNMSLGPIKILKRNRKETEKEAYNMLERLGIPELAENYPSQISGGQAQRAAIARGLMMHPKIMLLDEPTSALDLKTTNDFAEWLKELNEKTTFIAVTHDIPFAKKVAQHGICLNKGEISSSGDIKKIASHMSSANY